MARALNRASGRSPSARASRWAGLLALLVLPAASARGALYHPELLLPHHGPALIDCARGFHEALLDYFAHFAARDGIRAAGVPALELASPDARASRFRARFPDGTVFTGFIYDDPTLTEAENEPGEDEGDPAQRVCSAVFVDARATPDETALLERGWLDTLIRLGEPDPDRR